MTHHAHTSCTHRPYLRSLVDVRLEVPLRLHVKITLLRAGHVELLQQLSDVAVRQRQRSLLEGRRRHRWRLRVGPRREPAGGGVETLSRLVRGGELPAAPLETLLLLSLLKYPVETGPRLLIRQLLLLHCVPVRYILNTRTIIIYVDNEIHEIFQKNTTNDRRK